MPNPGGPMGPNGWPKGTESWASPAPTGSSPPTQRPLPPRDAHGRFTSQSSNTGGNEAQQLLAIAREQTNLLKQINASIGMLRRMAATDHATRGGPGRSTMIDRGGYGGYGRMNAFRAGLDIVRGMHGLGRGMLSGGINQSLYFGGQIARGASYFMRGGGGSGDANGSSPPPAPRANPHRITKSPVNPNATPSNPHRISKPPAGGGMPPPRPPVGAAGAAAGAGGSGGAGALSGAAGALANPAVLAVAAVAAAAVIEVAFIVALKNAADELIEFRRSLAEVSPSMAAIYAQRDIKEMLRDRTKGEMLAQSTGNLINQEQRYKDAILPIEMAWEELKTNFLAGLYSNIADISEGIRDIAEKFGIVLKKQDQSQMLHTFSGQINKIADDARKNQDRAKKDARRPR